MTYPNNGPVRSCRQAGWDADAERATERRRRLNGMEAAQDAEDYNLLMDLGLIVPEGEDTPHE